MRVITLELSISTLLLGMPESLVATYGAKSSVSSYLEGPEIARRYPAPKFQKICVVTLAPDALDSACLSLLSLEPVAPAVDEAAMCVTRDGGG